MTRLPFFPDHPRRRAPSLRLVMPNMKRRKGGDVVMRREEPSTNGSRSHAQGRTNSRLRKTEGTAIYRAWPPTTKLCAQPLNQAIEATIHYDCHTFHYCPELSCPDLQALSYLPRYPTKLLRQASCATQAKIVLLLNHPGCQSGAPSSADTQVRRLLMIG